MNNNINIRGTILNRGSLLCNVISIKRFNLIYILVFLNILDILTTHIGLKTGASEANPIMSGLISELGEAFTYCIKLTIVLVAALVIFKLGNHQSLILLCLGMTAVVISNLVIFFNSIL